MSENLTRKDGSVFVSVIPPKPIQQQIEASHQPRMWAGVAQSIGVSDPTPEPDPTPTIDEVFAESLPLFIEASRWGRYILPGPASRVFDSTTFIYHNPCPNFWDLYEMAKGIFRDLGIRLTKRGGTWLAHIPIKCLTDKVFIDSGLAGVERTLMQHTGVDPVKMLREIQNRQFEETRKGIAQVKRNRAKALAEAVGDAVGVLAMTAVSWAAYVVLGGVS